MLCRGWDTICSYMCAIAIAIAICSMFLIHFLFIAISATRLKNMRQELPLQTPDTQTVPKMQRKLHDMEHGEYFRPNMKVYMQNIRRCIIHIWQLYEPLYHTTDTVCNTVCLCAVDGCSLHTAKCIFVPRTPLSLDKVDTRPGTRQSRAGKEADVDNLWQFIASHSSISEKWPSFH